MDINATVENLLELIKIHSFEESIPGFILNIKTLILLEQNNHIPTMNLLTSGYHSIFGIAALANPHTPDNVIGIMDLKKAEALRRIINLQDDASKEYLNGITEVMKPGLFLYKDDQYLMLDINRKE